MTKRWFHRSWTVEETAACFIVKDHAGQKLAYVCFEDEPGRRPAAALARRLAILRLLPDLLRRS